MTNHNVKETKVVKDVDEWITVRQLHKKGMSIRGIARELKMSKNTVKKLPPKQPLGLKHPLEIKLSSTGPIINYW